MMEYYKGKDDWFDKNWVEEITPEFAEWWEEYYGTPEDSEDIPEYFTRMAFAFIGWLAGRE